MATGRVCQPETETRQILAGYRLQSVYGVKETTLALTLRGDHAEVVMLCVFLVKRSRLVQKGQKCNNMAKQSITDSRKTVVGLMLPIRVFPFWET